MTDDDLMTAVREQRDRVPMSTPVEDIISRGRAIRARRRVPAVAGAVAVAAGAAVAVTTLMPGSHQAGHQSAATLTAWTVTRQPDGKIVVTIRELRDPAGLQRTLRADGVPASVSFSQSGPPAPAACQPYNISRAGLGKVYDIRAHARRPVLVISPSALPAGAGVSIFDHVGWAPPGPKPRHTVGSGSGQPGPLKLAVGLVHASPQCTGS